MIQRGRGQRAALRGAVSPRSEGRSSPLLLRSFGEAEKSAGAPGEASSKKRRSQSAGAPGFSKGDSRTIVLGVTGGIACYKSCDLINRLRDDGWDVLVVMTKESKAFITPLTLQALSGHQVFDDLLHPVAGWDPIHTTLAERAALVLVSPATANLIGKIAHGLCDDLLSCVITATEAPVVFVPAMNDAMYRKRAVQENIALLTRRGYRFVPPTRGHLVCRTEGIGHVAEVETIVSEVRRIAGGSRQRAR